MKKMKKIKRLIKRIFFNKKVSQFAQRYWFILLVFGIFVFFPDPFDILLTPPVSGFAQMLSLVAGVFGSLKKLGVIKK